MWVIVLTKKGHHCSFVQALILCVLTGAVWIIFSVRADVYARPKSLETVNPHWTGNHCRECHGDKTPSAEQLLFGGDSVALCNRCHTTAFAGTEIHPVGVVMTQSMLEHFDKDWPLDEKGLSCLTCHDVISQMYADYARQQKNPKFLRGDPYKKISEFCFTCHVKSRYTKTNPHIGQLTPAGEPVEESCLFCHTTLPDPDKTHSLDELSFTLSRAEICISCHADKKSMHPARADHIGAFPDAMKQELYAQEQNLAVDLPLLNLSLIHI